MLVTKPFEESSQFTDVFSAVKSPQSRESRCSRLGLLYETNPELCDCVNYLSLSKHIVMMSFSRL